MRLAVSDDDLAPVLIALHEDDGPEAVLVQRAAPGWVVEFYHPVQASALARVFTLGASPLASAH